MNVSESFAEYRRASAMNYATIEAWISIEEWQTGAAIFNQSDESNQFSIKLGDESKKELLVESTVIRIILRMRSLPRVEHIRQCVYRFDDRSGYIPYSPVYR